MHGALSRKPTKGNSRSARRLGVTVYFKGYVGLLSFSAVTHVPHMPNEYGVLFATYTSEHSNTTKVRTRGYDLGGTCKDFAVLQDVEADSLGQLVD